VRSGSVCFILYTLYVLVGAQWLSVAQCWRLLRRVPRASGRMPRVPCPYTHATSEGQVLALVAVVACAEARAVARLCVAHRPTDVEPLR